MGEVYLARDLRLKRDVALKVLPDAHRFDAHRAARLDREAQVLASLNHPNIATLHGVETSAGVQALVMEFVDGETLAERISSGPLPIPLALGLARQIVDALDAAHERGIVHRDLKPANIKIRPDGRVKVLDFGLAKAFDVEGEPATIDAPTLTATNATVAGTAAYMSPEQARGVSIVDRRTDIWAFGCVLFEMLTGHRAFDGATSSDAMAAVLTSEPEWHRLPPATPASVRLLLRRCLDKDARQRLRDIADARDSLQDGHQRGAATADGAITTPRRSTRLIVQLAAAAIVVVLGALLLARLSRSTLDDRSDEFNLLPPEGALFGGGAVDRTPAFAISPDGERLAFVATDGRQRQQLWVREIRSLSALPLGGTDNARAPFWSPDGAFIGFFADGKLKKIPAAGGTATSLADARAGSGGTWNRDGVIVFAPDTQSGLLRVPDAGGTAMPVTTLVEGEYGHVYPQFLPDGRRLQYLARALPARKGIYVTSLDTSGATFVLRAREKARYAASGHLLFLEEGRLLARTFDTKTLQLGQDAVTITDSVAFIATDGRASYDVSETGVLVFRANGLLAASQPVFVDATGKTIASVGEPGDYQSASLSPDGSTLVVEKHDLKTSTGDLWLIDIARNMTTRFTSDGMHNTAGVWSPDGRSIVFTGRPDGVRNLHLKQVGAEADEPLLELGPDREPTDWQGSRIFYQEGPAGQKDLWMLHMPQRRPERLQSTPFNEVGARVSPNGRWLAYISNETGPEEVFVRPLGQDGGARRVSINGGTAPRWSRDGRELYYIAPDASVIAVAVNPRIGVTTGPPRVLFAADMRRIEISSTLTAASWFVVDGDRFFIVPNPPGPIPPALPLTVLNGWMSRLRH
jgi:Tol biopolymer transport system component